MDVVVMCYAGVEARSERLDGEARRGRGRRRDRRMEMNGIEVQRLRWSVDDSQGKGVVRDKLT